MEPSLRSSTQRGTQFAPRRPEPAVHEASKSFVESCWEDTRISQYADINYASRRLAKEKGYWLEPMGRVGYLIFLPRMPIVWIDEKFKVCLRLFMRVRSPIYEKKSVFIASLDKAEGLLRLEDCYLLRGKPLRDCSFSERWEELCDFYGTSFKEDSYAQQGLRVELASYKPLVSALEWQTLPEKPAMMLWQPEVGPRRFRVQLEQQQQQQQQPQLQPLPTATVVPHPSYPDTYELSIGGVKKGFAAVQDLALSQQLRSATVGSKEIPVTVEWNPDFSMYQILSIVKADGRQP